jgi:hypothetical protein
MKRLTLGLVGAAALFTLWACGGSSDDDTCKPGAATACTGDKGCEGKKICNDDGSAYEACVCTHSGSGGAGGGDTSTGGGGIGGDPNFVPSDLSKLVLWLEADTGVEGAFNNPAEVGKWHDQSKYGQVASTGDPFVTFKDESGNTFIGCPSGGSMAVNDDPALQFGTGDFTVAMVIEDVSDKAQTVFWSKDPTGAKTFDFVTGIDDRWDIDLGGVAVPIPKPSHPGNHVVIFRRDTKTDLVIDGTEYEGSALAGDLDAVGTPLTLCAPGAGIKSNAIAAVIAIKGASTDTDLGNLDGYLRRKYGI